MTGFHQNRLIHAYFLFSIFRIIFKHRFSSMFPFKRKNIFILDDYKQPTVRVSYNGSARIIIDSLQQKDEGWMACSIDFDSGQTIFSKVFLVVGSKNIVHLYFHLHFFMNMDKLKGPYRNYVTQNFLNIKIL